MASSSSSSTRRDHHSSHHRSRDARADHDDDDGELPWWEQDRSNTAGGAGAGRGFDSTASHRRRDYDDRRLEHAKGYYDRDAHYSGGGLPYDRDPAAAAPPSSYRDRDRHYDRDRHRPRRDVDYRTSTMTTPRERERAPDPHPPLRRLDENRGRGGDEDGFTPHAQRNVAHHPPPPPSSSASVPSLSSGTGGLNSRAGNSAAASNGVEEGEIPRSTKEDDDDDMELSLDPVPEPDPEQILAERRRKRAEILAKYAAASTASAANSTAPSSLDATPEPGSLHSVSGLKREGASAAGGEEGGGAGTPGRPEVERAAKRLRIQGTDSPAVAAASTPGLAATTTAPTTAASTPGLSTRSGSLSVDPIAAAAGAVTASSSSTTANSTAMTPHANVFSLEKDAETSKEELTALPREDEADEISAADYNPDQGDDDRRRVHGQGQGNASAGDRKEEVKVESDDEEEEEVEVEEEDDDDEDDMFAIGTADDKPKKTKKVVKRKKEDQTNVPLVNRALPSAADSTNPSLLADNYDDAEGYYRVILGEALDQNRYHVVAHLGKGMFSSVVRARDLGEKGEGRYEGEEGKGLGGKGVGEGERREVAIKIVRSQESMYKAGLKEAQILRKLRDADPDDKKHLVRLHRTFEHRGHLCLVFESLSMNLREVVKRYGKDVGLNLRAVRAYASQMFLALALMRKCEIMHADLKPDNILVNESKSTLKVSDLGSASDVTENEITPYLVSRFYRAPEIILGLPYDCSLDVWSIACTLYELYTGKILFPGRTNNHMLLLIMETKGKFNHKVIRKARFHDQHFDENMTFLYTEKNDTITPRAIPAKPSSDLRSRLMPPGVTRRLKEEEGRLLTNFVDLLEKMLSLEPARRPSPKELLNHPFIRG